MGQQVWGRREYSRSHGQLPSRSPRSSCESCLRVVWEQCTDECIKSRSTQRERLEHWRERHLQQWGSRDPVQPQQRRWTDHLQPRSANHGHIAGLDGDLSRTRLLLSRNLFLLSRTRRVLGFHGTVRLAGIFLGCTLNARPHRSLDLSATAVAVTYPNWSQR